MVWGFVKRQGRVHCVRKTITICLALLVFVQMAALMGCDTSRNTSSPSAASSASATSESTPLRVGYWTAGFAPELIVARNQNFFSAYGLTVELVPLEGSLIESVMNTDIDFFIGDPVTLEAACLGLPVQAIDVLHTGGIQGFTYPKSDITSFADLRGKRVGVPLMAGFAQLLMKAEMDYAGIDTSTVEWVTYDERDLLMSYVDLESGVLDALLWPDPYGEIAERLGCSKFYSSSMGNVTGAASTTYVMATATDAAADFHTRAALCCALQDAGAFIQENPEKVASELREDALMSCFTDFMNEEGISESDQEILFMNLLGTYQWEQGSAFFDESVRQGLLIALYGDKEFRLESGLQEVGAFADNTVDAMVQTVSVFGGEG